MTRTLSHRQSVILGAIALACLSFGVWGLVRVSGKSSTWAATFDMRVAVTEAPDIQPGSTVQIRGLEAGQVDRVEFTADGVMLHLKVDRRFQSSIYADATAMVKSRGMFGSNVVAVYPGTSAAGSLGDQPITAKVQPDLAEVTAKLNNIADRVDDLLKGVQEGKGTLPKLLKDETVYNDLKDSVAEAKKLLKNLDGTVTTMRDDAQKTLNRVNSAVTKAEGELDEVKQFVRNGNEAVTAIKQDAEAIKGLPIVRSYVDDPVAVLVRPTCERDRVVFRTDTLFEPGSAVLTSQGRQKLDETAAWLNGQRVKESEIAVAAFADAKAMEETFTGARALTKKQSEVATEYLRDRGVHKMGWVTRRKVSSVGLGFDPSPVLEKEILPAARVEIILFVPRQ